MSSQILWTGNYLDGTLTIALENRRVAFEIVSYDLEYTGMLILKRPMQPKEIVDAVIGIIDRDYVELVMQDKKECIEKYHESVH